MILFILNSSSGSGECDAMRALIEERFAAAGREARIVLACSGDELIAAVREGIAAGAEAVVAGGGDGTISTVAAELVHGGIPLGVVPLGTLNHFAKDLGIPLEPAAALDAVLGGHTVRVDTGEVNGRVFLNNSSLGLYARIVRLRQRYPAHGIAKWIVAAWAMLKVMEHNPEFAVRIGANGESKVYRTSLVMVGNNPYRMAGLDAGGRESLAEGTLAVYVVRTRGKLRLAKLVGQIIAGRAEQADDLEMHQVTSVAIETSTESAAVALDGEVAQLETPLLYRVRPGALKVLVAT